MSTPRGSDLVVQVTQPGLQRRHLLGGSGGLVIGLLGRCHIAILASQPVGCPSTPAGITIPLGVVTGLIGAPVFLVVMGRRSYEYGGAA